MTIVIYNIKLIYLLRLLLQVYKMKSYCILLAILFCLIAVEGRTYHEKYTNSEQNENSEINHLRYRPEKRTRNRRQSYHNGYVRTFQNNEVGDFLKNIMYSVREIETHVKQGSSNRYYPGYYDNRRDYSNKCEDSIQELLTISKELLLHLRNPPPPPPPQIVYIPYPYPAPFNLPAGNVPSKVNISDRIIPKDTNRIWPYTPKDTGTEDNDDGSRPVSFKPIRPKNEHVTPPPFEHGSTQEGLKTTTPSPLKKPGSCEAAILSCCGAKTQQEQEKCFNLYKCSKSYETGLACSPDVIKMVLDNFSKMYGPINEF